MAGSPIVVDRPGGRRMVVVGAGNGDFDSEVRAFALRDGDAPLAAPVAGVVPAGRWCRSPTVTRCS